MIFIQHLQKFCLLCLGHIYLVIV